MSKNPSPFMNRRQLLSMSALTIVLPAWAQSGYPSKPITILVPFPAGGGTDTFARPLSAQFAKISGKAMVIDNRGGAGGNGDDE